MKECLFNTNSNNVAAYCRYHHCGMTVKQMRCKDCLKKQCHYIVKNENHQYWKQREATKQKRKDRKQMINEYVSQFM
jgi:hypothetical protein